MRMKSTTSGRGIRILVTLAIVVGVVIGVHMLLSRWLREQVRSRIAAAAEACGSQWVERDGSQLWIDLIAGDLLLTNVQWQRTGDPLAFAPAVSGRLDSVIVSGISYRALLFHDRVDAARFVLQAADLDVALSQDSTPPSEGRDGMRFKVGRLDVRLNDTAVRLADSTQVHVGDLGLKGEEVLLDLADTVFHAGKLEGVANALLCSPFSDSTLTVDRVSLNDAGRTLRIDGLRFGPAGVKGYAVNVEQERDVIAGEVEHITLAGIEATAAFRGMPHLRVIRIGPSTLRVARDKSRPDQAFRHKPLPARSLRSLPAGVGCDSLVVERLSVHYFERVDSQRGFALIPFDSIKGVLTHVHHRHGDTLHLKATAFAFGATPVSLDLSGHVGDSTDHIVVEAHVGRLAFPALSGVLVPLTGVATPEGRLDTLIMRMNGRDQRASAQCLMRYDGLRLSRKTGRGRERQKLIDTVFDGLLNAAVKSHHTGRRKNEGWKSYAWERRRDRAIFNYLWAGVREGAKTNMLHNVVLETTSRNAQHRRR